MTFNHPISRHSLQTGIACTLLMSAVCTLPVLAGYGPPPLQPALSAEAHFQTDGSREGHRHAGAVINKYRLYDFYARQAEYHLKKGTKAPALLLPHPGLEGGRRGHWGGSNLPTHIASTVTWRTKDPEYFRVVERENQRKWFIFSPKVEGTEKRTICQLDVHHQSLKKVFINATAKSKPSAFTHKIERFCAPITVTGKVYLENQGADWFTDAAHPVLPPALKTKGYYVHGDNVIYRRAIHGVEFLDMPHTDERGESIVYHRLFSWEGKAPRLMFRLPVAGGKFKENDPAEVAQHRKGEALYVSLKRKKFTTHYLFVGGKVEFSQESAVGFVTFSEITKGSNHRISCWITNTGEKQELPQRPPVDLSNYIKGGKVFFPKTIAVQGKLNADPNAKGSGYAIDDIPVPIKNNPYGTPMTISGLAFSKDGSAAYVATVPGDVWKVSGLKGDLKKVVWKRFASGIPKPLGLCMMNGVLHVCANSKIVRLYDYNGDDEADYYEDFYPIGANYLSGLSKDDHGNLYTVGTGGMLKISTDSNGQASHVKIGRGARNPFGIGVRGDGLMITDSSEGHNTPTCEVFESNHPENAQSANPYKTILYIPRGVDNSPGDKLFLNNNKWGPIGRSIFSASFGSGRVYYMLRDKNQGTPQAALCLLPMEISSGASRLKEHPVDGSIYIVGLDGWGDYAITEGCLHRVRYTGEPCLKVTGWRAYKNGVSFTFNTPVDSTTVQQKNCMLQQWNYIRSAATYGSPEYSVRKPGSLGHDMVKINSVHLSADGTELFVEAQDLLPSMAMHFYGGQIRAKNGASLKVNVFATLNKLHDNHSKGKPVKEGKPLVMKEPNKPSNGDTYSTITRFFAKRKGVTIEVKYGDAPPAYERNQLNYAWINKHLIQKQCILCHTAGSPFDFSSYDKLLKIIDRKHPEQSKMMIMVQSQSMPPSPIPKVHPKMLKALSEWLKDGAKK